MQLIQNVSIVPASSTTARHRLAWRAQRLVVHHPFLWSTTIVAIATAAIWAVQQTLTIPSELSGLTIPTALPLYLIAVLLCATTVGRWPAAVCACLAFVAYKLFFIEPRLTLILNDSGDVLNLATFLVTAAIGGGLAVWVRDQADEARRRAAESTALYDLSLAISIQLEFDAIAPTIAETTMRLLACRACSVVIYHPDGTLNEVAKVGTWDPSLRRVETALSSASRRLGVLRIGREPEQPPLDPPHQRLFDTLAAQAGLALERSRLAQMAAQTKALAESDRLKSTLLTAISHDFRTPLASITAAADELVAEDVVWPETARRDFSRVIRTEAERLNRLVGNLLDLTRLEAGVLDPHRGWYNIAEIVNSVLERLAPDLSDRQVDVDVPDDLPLVPVDFVQLGQVLWNVLENALKYSDKGTPISVCAIVQDEELVLTIGDRGRGIPCCERTRVFEKFYRVDAPDHARVPGSGVGLAICKGLIGAHGGRIGIADHPGGGTLLHIALPLGVPDAASRESV